MAFDRKLLRFIKKNFMYHDYIANQGLATQPGNMDELRICCPRCEEDDFKCYVNDEKKTFCCFKCDFGHYGNGDVFDFVANVEGISVGAAMSRLCSDYRSVTPEDISFEEEEGAVVPVPPSFENIKTIENLPMGTFLIDENDSDAKPYIDYLLGRGFTMDEILATQTHYTCSLARHRKNDGKKVNIGNRVLWPVYGGKGDLVSWLTRAVSDDPEKKHIKYINCPDTELSKTFWPFVPMAPGKTDAVIVEGLIDALSLRRAGFAAYATFGKKMSEEQILLLKHWGVDSITIFYDMDAKKEIVKLADEIKMRFANVYVVDVSSWPKGQDSGSLLAREDGCEILMKTLTNRINVSDEFAFLKWRIQ